MVYLDRSNTCFLRQVGAELSFVPQDEAAAGADWRPFSEWDVDGDLSPEEVQEVFDSLIRCQAPVDRITAHLREDEAPEGQP
jgi:hypothetical protein